MAYLDRDMLYAAIFTATNILAIGGAGWLLLFPYRHPDVENSLPPVGINWAKRA
jgi:hypothetical protein